MPRPAKKVSLTPGQAAYVVERAVADRRLSTTDVNRYLTGMRDEISALEERLGSLREAVVTPVKHVAERVVATVKKRRRRAQRKALSAERQASQRLQGQYLGFLRQIPERQKERFKKMARDVGREKAVAAMRKTLGK